VKVNHWLKAINGSADAASGVHAGPAEPVGGILRISRLVLLVRTVAPLTVMAAREQGHRETSIKSFSNGVVDWFAIVVVSGAFIGLTRRHFFKENSCEGE
jgi:hypothetical protein